MTLGLLTKVLHRLRPRLLPIDDRAVSRRYARAAGTTGRLPFDALVAALRDDLRDPDNAAALDGTGGRLAADLAPAPVPTPLRLLDIAVWMAEGR